MIFGRVDGRRCAAGSIGRRRDRSGSLGCLAYFLSARSVMDYWTHGAWHATAHGCAPAVMRIDLLGHCHPQEQAPPAPMPRAEHGESLLPRTHSRPALFAGTGVRRPLCCMHAVVLQASTLRESVRKLLMRRRRVSRSQGPGATDAWATGVVQVPGGQVSERGRVATSHNEPPSQARHQAGARLHS